MTDPPESPAERHDVIIVGGGIAGLTAAWRLRDLDVLVLEAGDRAGGRMKSEQRGEYWLNWGPHLFGGPESIVGGLAEEFGIESRPVRAGISSVAFGREIILDGRVSTYPLRLPLSPAARLSFIRAGLRLRLAARAYEHAARQRPGEAPSAARHRRLAYLGDVSFADWIGRVHPDAWAILRTAADRLAAPPDQVTAGRVVSSFSLLWGRGRAENHNLVGGPSTVPAAIAKALGEQRVLTGAEVTEIVDEGGDVRVTATVAGQARELRAGAVIVATPAYAARQIARGLPAETAAALEGMRYGTFVVAAMLTGEEGPMPWDRAYSISVAGRSFHMFTNEVSILRQAGPRAPGGSLTVNAGGELATRLAGRTDGEVIDTFVRDLEDLYPEARGIVREAVVQRWLYPFPRAGRYKLQAALERPLGRLFLAGDYLDSDYAGMEVAAASGLRAARGARALVRPMIHIPT